MWSAMPPECTAVAVIDSSLFSLQAIEKCNQICDILRGKTVGRGVRHRTHAARKACLKDSGHILRRRRLVVDQAGMRWVVQYVTEARADQRLAERRDLMTGHAFLGKERLAGRNVAVGERNRSAARCRKRVAYVRVLLLPHFEPCVERRLLLDHEILLVHLAML